MDKEINKLNKKIDNQKNKMIKVVTKTNEELKKLEELKLQFQLKREDINNKKNK